jgi:hypothetical protein
MTLPGALGTNGVQLQATTNSNLATVSLGNGGSSAIVEGFNWSLTLSSPITMGGSSDGGSSATNTDIATLNGLANGFSATLKLYRFDFVGLGNGDAASDAIVQKAVQACKTAGKITSDACDKLGMLQPDTAVQTYDKADFPAYVGPFFPGKYGVRAMTYGLQSAVGYNAFTFYNPRTLVKSSENSEPWSAGGFAGAVLATSPAYPTMINVAANYQNAFTAQSSSTMCLSQTGGVNCQTGSFGAPKHVEKMLLSLGSDTLVTIAGHPVGLGPQFTYDAIGHTVGIDFPIYFITNATGGLNAGISAGWTSDKHDFSVGFIVGVPFNVIGSQ